MYIAMWSTTSVLTMLPLSVVAPGQQPKVDDQYTLKCLSRGLILAGHVHWLLLTVLGCSMCHIARTKSQNAMTLPSLLPCPPTVLGQPEGDKQVHESAHAHKKKIRWSMELLEKKTASLHHLLRVWVVGATQTSHPSKVHLWAFHPRNLGAGTTKHHIVPQFGASYVLPSVGDGTILQLDVLDRPLQLGYLVCGAWHFLEHGVVILVGTCAQQRGVEVQRDIVVVNMWEEDTVLKEKCEWRTLVANVAKRALLWRQGKQ